MIKVLLVDDEKMALDYLNDLINWEAYGFRVVGMALDGEMAIRLFKQQRPELVITDIKMPGLSGIDLASIIRESDSDVRILFLSSYADFNYVKQAIRLNVDDYLIKADLNEEMLIKKLLQVKDSMQKVKEAKAYTLRKMMQDIFSNGSGEEKYGQWIDEQTFVRLVRPYYYILILMQTPLPVLESYIPMQEYPHVSLEESIQEIWNKNQNGSMTMPAVFSIDNTSYIAVFHWQKNISLGNQLEQQMYQCARLLYDSLNTDSGMPCSVIYSTKSCTVKEFRDYYKAHKDELVQRFLANKPILIHFEDMRKEGNPSADSALTVDMVRTAIKENKVEFLERLFENIVMYQKANDYIAYLWWTKKLVELLQQFDGKVEGKKSGRVFSLASSITNYDLLYAQGVIKMLKDKTMELSSIMHEQFECSYSKNIERMIEYIRKNYADPDISIVEISASCGLSPAWGTSKFKEEVNIGINEFLNEYRIKKACSLFDSNDYMIYEVAELTGFTSSQYFSKVFKKITGLTPNQYKNKGIGQIDENT